MSAHYQKACLKELTISKVLYIYMHLYPPPCPSGTKWSVWADEKFHSRSCARACLPVAVFLPVPVPVSLPVSVSLRNPRPSARRPCVTFLRLFFCCFFLLAFFTDFDAKGAKMTPKGSQNGAQSRLRTSLFGFLGNLDFVRQYNGFACFSWFRAPTGRPKIDKKLGLKKRCQNTRKKHAFYEHF